MLSKFLTTIVGVGILIAGAHYLPKHYGEGMPDIAWSSLDEGDIAEQQEEAMRQWMEEEAKINAPALL